MEFKFECAFQGKNLSKLLSIFPIRIFLSSSEIGFAIEKNLEFLSVTISTNSVWTKLPNQND